MNLRIVILPAKVLADGTHKIRIAISHNGQTRYFLTRFNVPSPSNLVGGQVVGVNNASYINQQLRIRMSKIYSICDSAKDIDYYTCSQLVQYIDTMEKNAAPKTFHNIWEKFYDVRHDDMKKNTVLVYQASVRSFEEFFGKDFLLQTLTSNDMKKFEKDLKGKGFSQTSIAIKIRHIRAIINYAMRQKLVDYDVEPFSDYKGPVALRRDCALTIDEIRKIRDADLSECPLRVRYARDIFMLSFYLCGMNLADILENDFSKPYVKFCRTKTQNRRKIPTPTQFTIQPEARSILDKISVEGHLKERTLSALSRILYDGLPTIKQKCGIENQFIFYSARKSFAQIANQLFVKDSIIEYCIGDSVTISKKAIGFYINVTPQMADFVIRKIFDAVASNLSIEELQKRELEGVNDYLRPR